MVVEVDAGLRPDRPDRLADHRVDEAVRQFGVGTAPADHSVLAAQLGPEGRFRRLLPERPEEFLNRPRDELAVQCQALGGVALSPAQSRRRNRASARRVTSRNWA